MKKILFVLTLFPFSASAKQIVLDISDSEIAIVENDVVNAEQWIRDAWNGKLSKCKERLIKKEIELSLKESESIPASETEIIDKHFKRKDYRNRKQRDEDEKRGK